jgi:hypothetical protein
MRFPRYSSSPSPPAYGICRCRRGEGLLHPCDRCDLWLKKKDSPEGHEGHQEPRKGDTRLLILGIREIHGGSTPLPTPPETPDLLTSRPPDVQTSAAGVSAALGYESRKVERYESFPPASCRLPPALPAHTTARCRGHSALPSASLKPPAARHATPGAQNKNTRQPSGHRVFSNRWMCVRVA